MSIACPPHGGAFSRQQGRKHEPLPQAPDVCPRSIPSSLAASQNQEDEEVDSSDEGDRCKSEIKAYLLVVLCVSTYGNEEFPRFHLPQDVPCSDVEPPSLALPIFGSDELAMANGAGEH